MHRSLRILIAITIALVFTSIPGFALTVLAQPASVPQRVASPFPETVSPGMPRLSASLAYTVYLPLVLVSPPEVAKKGVGIANSPACSDLQKLKAGWYLNWSVAPDPTCSSADAHKFVPRITGAASMNTLAIAVQNARASGWLMGFSEPNLPWQSNLAPGTAAVYWRQIEDAARPLGIRLVSPAPNQYAPGVSDPYGHQWTWEMVRQYELRYGRKPHFDAIAWNIYKRNSSETIQYLTSRRNEALARGYDVPIWVTEYGGECWWSGHNNTAVMQQVTAWFNQTPWIGRYAWFANRIGNETPGWQSCSLLNANTNALTSLGQLYAGY